MENPRQGTKLRLKLRDIVPTQPDDGLLSTSINLIEVIYDRGRWLLQHGHHRYYDVIRNYGLNERIGAVVARNFYIDY